MQRTLWASWRPASTRRGRRGCARVVGWRPALPGVVGRRRASPALRPATTAPCCHDLLELRKGKGAPSNGRVAPRRCARLLLLLWGRGRRVPTRPTPLPRRRRLAHRPTTRDIKEAGTGWVAAPTTHRVM